MRTTAISTVYKQRKESPRFASIRRQNKQKLMKMTHKQLQRFARGKSHHELNVMGIWHPRSPYPYVDVWKGY